MVLVTSGSAIASDKNMEAFHFEEADTNNDGYLTKKEVKDVQLKQMKGPEAKAFFKKINVTQEQVKKIEHDMVDKFFAAGDLDKDGKITKKESDQLNQKAGEKLETLEKKMKLLFKEEDFKKADKDGDDHWTKQEMKDFYKNDLMALFAKASLDKKPDPEVSQ